MTKYDHKPECPRAQAWDISYEDCNCTCGGPYIVDKDGSLRTDYGETGFERLRTLEGELEAARSGLYSDLSIRDAVIKATEVAIGQEIERLEEGA